MIAAEELQEWLSMSVVHDGLTGTDGLYNPLLLGAVNGTKNLAASAIDFVRGWARCLTPGMVLGR